MNRLVDTSSTMVTLYDFTAKWCGPCRTMKPVLDALAKEYAGKVQLVEVDVDDDQLTTQQFNVRAMPTYVLVRDGREVGRFVGSRPRAFVAGVLDRALSGDVQITAP
ncbi:MAG TPA: thioredoxin family protein [Kofleriaceae bacterium]|nr:thioredoxin family protein [Kofleriaceae bacterium]